MKAKILKEYTNGNISVALFSDGTRTMEYEGEPNPYLPSSSDVKITNYCDAGCQFCHEQSNTKGKHGDLDKLLNVLLPMAGGKEIAVGGGNTLSHPELISFLKTLKSRGTICNMTINQKHIYKDMDKIKHLTSKKLIRGMGISYSDPKYLQDIKEIMTDDTVFHLIMGINKLSDIDDLNKFCKENGKKCKVLILGYKNYGMGINYYLKNKTIEDNKYQWFIKLAKHFKDDNLVLSFDNLAIEQLKLKRYFTNEAWEKFYQGNDGTTSMFIDGVKQEFAKSSTSKERVSFDKMSLKQFFDTLRKQ